MVSVIIILDLLTLVLMGCHFEGLRDFWTLLESLWDERRREKSTTRVHMCCVVIVSRRRCKRHCHTKINILSQRYIRMEAQRRHDLRIVCSPRYYCSRQDDQTNGVWLSQHSECGTNVEQVCIATE